MFYCNQEGCLLLFPSGLGCAFMVLFRFFSTQQEEPSLRGRDLIWQILHCCPYQMVHLGRTYLCIMECLALRSHTQSPGWSECLLCFMGLVLNMKLHSEELSNHYSCLNTYWFPLLTFEDALSLTVWD